MSWNVVDSSGWLEYFAEGPNAGFFAKPLNDAPRLLVPAVCIYEVAKVMRSRNGNAAAEEAMALMRQATVVPLSPDLAYGASKISIERGMAMADSMIVATADAFDAVIWTQDSDFATLPGVQFKEKKK